MTRLGRVLQTIELPELRAMGQAIEATLAEDREGAGPDPDDRDCFLGWGAR